MKKFELMFDLSKITYTAACYLTVRVGERLDIPVEDERIETTEDGRRWVVLLEAESLDAAIERMRANLPEEVELIKGES